MTEQQAVIRIGRLEKKVKKLIQQRDHYKNRIAFFDEVLRYYPYAMRTHEDKMRHRAEREELEMLRKRVKEQEKLIDLMMKKEPE